MSGDEFKTGWMYKRGHVVHSWKRRFFVLNRKSQLLSYFGEEVDVAQDSVQWPEPKGQLLIAPGINVQKNPHDDASQFGIFVAHAPSHSDLWIRAGSREEQEEWIAAICAVVRESDAAAATRRNEAASAVAAPLGSQHESKAADDQPTVEQQLTICDSVARNASLLPTGEFSLAPGDRSALVNSMNGLLKLWERQSDELASMVKGAEFHVQIPAFGMDVTGIGSVLPTLKSLDPNLLGVHAASTHTIRAVSAMHAEMHCYSHVFNRSTGEVFEHGELLTRWEREPSAPTGWLCTSYRQDVEYIENQETWTTWKPRQVRLPTGVEVSVVDTNPTSGSDPVVFLHGLGDSLYAWSDLVPLLSCKRGILISLVGFGDSSKPSAEMFGFSAAAQAEAITLTLAALGVDTATLVGHSFGAAVALHMAAEFPARYPTLVLVDGVQLVADSPTYVHVRNTLSSMTGHTVDEGFAISWIKPFLDAGTWSLKRYQRALSQKLLTSPRVLLTTWESLPQVDMAEMAARYTGRAMFVSGATDQQALETMESLTKVVNESAGSGRAEFIVIDGADHFPHNSHPKELATHVDPFISGSPDLRVHRFNGVAAHVNSWLFMNATHLVVIDCLRDPDEADALIETIEGLGRTLQAIFITHGHPDHWLGAGKLHARYPDATIYVADAVIMDDIKGFNDFMANAGWLDDHPDMKRKTTDNPDGFDFDGVLQIYEGSTFQLEGGGSLQLRWDYPPTESMHMTTLYCPEANIFFASDFCYNHIHCYSGPGVELEHVHNWIVVLGELAERYAGAFIMPGHGPAGGAEIFRNTKHYLQRFLSRRESAMTNNELKDGMVTEFPAYPEADFLLELSVSNLGPESKPASES